MDLRTRQIRLRSLIKDAKEMNFNPDVIKGYENDLYQVTTELNFSKGIAFE